MYSGQGTYYHHSNLAYGSPFHLQISYMCKIDFWLFFEGKWAFSKSSIVYIPEAIAIARAYHADPFATPRIPR